MGLGLPTRLRDSQPRRKFVFLGHYIHNSWLWRRHPAQMLAIIKRGRSRERGLDGRVERRPTDIPRPEDDDL